MRVARWVRRGEVVRRLRLLVRAVRGCDRRQNRQLVRRLAALRAECNVLKREIAALYDYTDAEIRQLKADNMSLEEAKDELQLLIWDLEEQVDGLVKYIAEIGRAGQKAEGKGQKDESRGRVEQKNSELDLSTLSLGIVGGHRATRRGVIRLLSENYGLRTWAEIPPLHEATTRQSELRAKICRCDLIVIITGYMSHPLTHAVYGLKEAGALAGKVVLLNCRGRSGVVREVLAEAAKIIKS